MKSEEKMRLTAIAAASLPTWCGMRRAGFRVEGSGLRDWDLGFRVDGFGLHLSLKISGSGAGVWGLGFRVWGSWFGVSGSGGWGVGFRGSEFRSPSLKEEFRAQGLGVSGLGFRVQRFGLSCLVFGVQGFGGSGLGFRVQGFGVWSSGVGGFGGRRGTAARSAPTYPGVARAIAFKSKSPSSRSREVSTRRIDSRAACSWLGGDSFSSSYTSTLGEIRLWVAPRPAPCGAVETPGAQHPPTPPSLSPPSLSRSRSLYISLSLYFGAPHSQAQLSGLCFPGSGFHSGIYQEFDPSEIREVKFWRGGVTKFPRCGLASGFWFRTAL